MRVTSLWNQCASRPISVQKVPWQVRDVIQDVWLQIVLMTSCCARLQVFPGHRPGSSLSFLVCFSSEATISVLSELICLFRHFLDCPLSCLNNHVKKCKYDASWGLYVWREARAPAYARGRIYFLRPGSRKKQTCGKKGLKFLYWTVSAPVQVVHSSINLGKGCTGM